MNNPTRFPNSNQAQNKETKFDRRARLLCDFQSKDIAPCDEFMDDPGGYRNSLSHKFGCLFDYILSFHRSTGKIFFSHRYAAEKCDISISHVKRALNKFKEDGILISQYRHMQSCLYRIAPDIFSSKVLSSLLPVLAAFFSISLLGSFPRNELQTQNGLYNNLNLRNERIITRPRDSKIPYKFSKIEEARGDTWFDMPKMRPKELEWYRTRSSRFDMPATKEDLSTGWVDLSSYSERRFEQAFTLNDENVIREWNEKKILKVGPSRPNNKELLDQTFVEEFVKMDNLDKLSPEQREKFKETAMHKLVPQSAKYFSAISLTLVGKLNLAKYSNSAIEYAKTKFDKRLHAEKAYKELCIYAEKFCVQEGVSVNYDAAKILFDLYGVDPDSTKTNSKVIKPEREEYIPKDIQERKVFMEYFYIEENKNKDFPLPNPKQGAYDEFLRSAAEATGQDEGILHQQFEQMYLSKDDQTEIHTQRETDPTQESQGDNLSNSTRLRLSKTNQSGTGIRTSHATRLF